MEEQTLHVRITQATDTLWEGEAFSVSSANVDGPFDVLPLHANFVTLLKDVPILIDEVGGSKKTYNFKQSVMYVQDNVVKIYSDRQMLIRLFVLESIP